MTDNNRVMLMLLALLGLAMISRLGSRICARLLQQWLPTVLVEGDQLLLWGGLLLSALSIGLLVLYLLFQP